MDDRRWLLVSISFVSSVYAGNKLVNLFLVAVAVADAVVVVVVA